MKEDKMRWGDKDGRMVRKAHIISLSSLTSHLQPSHDQPSSHDWPSHLPSLKQKEANQVIILQRGQQKQNYNPQTNFREMRW